MPTVRVFPCRLLMLNNTACTSLFAGCLLVFILLFAGESAGVMLAINSRMTVDLVLVGYDGLSEITLAREKVPARGSFTIDTPYTGLALLAFPEGQRYPVILQNESFTMNIEDPSRPPSFSGSDANDYLYAQLTGKEKETGTASDDFARLMIQAILLLESSSSIHTIAELSAKKKEFLDFVRDHYQDLRHSDIVRRLIARYFMMHEYVDYHVKGAPATDIRDKYQKAVLAGVGDWLEILSPYLPKSEILNYCVSLYYQRSMVSLASLIIDNYPNGAYCPGDKKEAFSFPGDLLISDGRSGSGERRLASFKGKKIIAFVSDDCPVSMVKTIIKVRQLADQKKEVKIIVAPLEKLSEKHLAMNRMVSNGSMYFIDGEQWCKQNLTKKIMLPLFIPLGDDLVLPDRTSTK